METTTWTPKVGDEFTRVDTWTWTVKGEKGTHAITTRYVVTDVDDRLARYERTAVLADQGAPDIEHQWTGPEAGTTSPFFLREQAANGEIYDISA